MPTKYQKERAQKRRIKEALKKKSPIQKEPNKLIKVLDSVGKLIGTIINK